MPTVRHAAPWAAARVSTRRTSSPRCGRSTSRHMWRRTTAGDARRSIAAPRVIPATPSASASANALRKRSAGPKRSPDCSRHAIADCPESTGSSSLPWPPTAPERRPSKAERETADRTRHGPSFLPRRFRLSISAATEPSPRPSSQRGHTHADRRSRNLDHQHPLQDAVPEFARQPHGDDTDRHTPDRRQWGRGLGRDVSRQPHRRHHRTAA